MCYRRRLQYHYLLFRQGRSDDRTIRIFICALAENQAHFVIRDLCLAKLVGENEQPTVKRREFFQLPVNVKSDIGANHSLQQVAPDVFFSCFQIGQHEPKIVIRVVVKAELKERIYSILSPYPKEPTDKRFASPFLSKNWYNKTKKICQP